MHVRTHARACTVQIVPGDKTRVNVPPSQPSYVLVAIVVKVFSRVEGGIAETFSLYYVLARTAFQELPTLAYIEPDQNTVPREPKHWEGVHATHYRT